MAPHDYTVEEELGEARKKVACLVKENKELKEKIARVDIKVRLFW